MTFLEDGVKNAFTGGLSVRLTYILSGLSFITGSFSSDGVHQTSVLLVYEEENEARGRFIYTLGIVCFIVAYHWSLLVCRSNSDWV